MIIDHIFIFSHQNGEEANDLINAGFIEGSSRIHPGQGTQNRKFYFENFFLEILWVNIPSEAQSKLTQPTHLWERSNFSNNDYSRFGLCLLNDTRTDELFKPSFDYIPLYLPPGYSIEFVSNKDRPELPSLFRLPTKNERGASNESTMHSNSIKKLTKAELLINTSLDQNELSGYSIDESLQLTASQTTSVVLSFDNEVKQRKIEIPSLDLTILY